MKTEAHTKLLEYQTDSVVSKLYNSLLIEAQSAYTQGNYSGCLSFLSKIPTKALLYDQLLDNLQGKRVVKTLRQISEGKVRDRYTILKAMSSLYTHAVIECERGEKEFERILPQILETLTRLTYKG